MPIIKNRTVVESDWLRAPEIGSIPDGRVVVPLARWLEQRQELIRRPGAVGIRVGAGDRVEPLAEDLSALPLIVLESDGFADGRCYSQARLLRERLGYRGEIRVLDVHPEHLAFLERCGADAFELVDGIDPHQALEHLDEIDVRYQPAADDGAL